jgi:hypothetical protein
MFDQVARRLRAVLAVLLGTLLLPWASSRAENQNVLIQLQADGSYRIWNAEGPSQLDDDEVMLLESLAEPEGSRLVTTALGPALARRTPLGVIIELQAAARDRSLLVDRDACGHLKTWHAQGVTLLSEDQATELVLSALPGGGPRVVLDAGRHAKAFLTNVGVMVAIWRPRMPARQP